MTERRTCTGILGGSFNPIHNGHLAIARAMVARGVVDNVLLMVTPHNPLKQASELADEQVRLRLARLACRGESHIIASDFEFSLPRPSFTWQTLEALRQAQPDVRFKLLIGADNWELFPRWYRADDIIANYEIALYPRPGYNIDVNTLPPTVQYVDMELHDISSTAIRQMIRTNRDISPYVPPLVYTEITTHGLFK